MKKRFAFAIAILFVVAIIMITISFNGFILPSTVVAQQQRMNSNTSSSQGTNSSPNPPILIAEILLGTTLGISSPLLFYVWKKERQDILMDLKKNEILQINSSIIVGVLILLTLGSTITHLHKVTISLITASIIVPFAVSSIMIIISQPPEIDEKGHGRKSFRDKNLKLFPASIMAMIVGFVYIIAAVITVTLIA
ncbi:MAG: hypothetical protein WBZ36_27845 [Candidatus Nitrosopolaris sp.]